MGNELDKCINCGKKTGHSKFCTCECLTDYIENAEKTKAKLKNVLPCINKQLDVSKQMRDECGELDNTQFYRGAVECLDDLIDRVKEIIGDEE